MKSSYKNIPHSEDSNYVSLGLRRHIPSRSLSVDEGVSYAQVLWFLLLHAPLLLVFRALPLIATLHSLVVFFVGLHYIIKDEQPVRAAWVLAYIAGSEILWRGVEAALVWEYAKYISLLLCIVMILKYRLFQRVSFWPILFVMLLIPGIFVAPNINREDIAFQLTGPVTLAVASFVFSSLSFKKTDLQRLFLSMIAPAVAMTVLVLVMLLTNDVQFYGHRENELITGEIGANQVSSALSLGAMVAFYYIFLTGQDRRMRNLMIWLFLGLLIFSVLTFSRSGLWNTFGAVVVSIYFLVRERQRKFSLFGLIVALAVVVNFIVVPLLTNITGGAVLARFSDLNTTGRDRFIKAEWKSFLENPIWGVGVGQSRYTNRMPIDIGKKTHTEYTRLLAEHGSLGVVVLVILAVVTASRVCSGHDPLWKGISVGLTAWTLLYLFHSATRLVAPSFTFGLAAANYLVDNEKNQNSETSLPDPTRSLSKS